MAAIGKQTAFVNLKTQAEQDAEWAEEQLEVEAGYVWKASLYSAIRNAIRELGGYGVVADALDRRWADHGSPVSASTLRAAFAEQNERNHARIEWLDYFAARSPEVAELMGRRVKPAKTAEERLADLEAELREELSHKRAEAVMRKARAR